MGINRGDSWDEDDISIILTVLPSGTRDFLLVRPETSEYWHVIHPVELLSLNRVARIIAVSRETQSDLMLNLALTRLLIWNLRFRGSGRHFAVEPWTNDDLHGTTLTADLDTALARNLKAEQVREHFEITSGQKRPAGATSELFWRAVVDLPELPATFVDPKLSQFAEALYLHLVPRGDGMVDVNPREVAAKINACWRSGFDALGLNAQPRELRKVFRRLLSLTVQWAGQLAGTAAEGVILAKRVVGDRPLTGRERSLLELRYGACQALGGVSFGFLNNCGPAMGCLITEYAYQVATGTEAEVSEAEENLREFVYLIAHFRKRRKLARAAERRDDRHRRADRMPHGPRRKAEKVADRSSPDPAHEAEIREELAFLQSLLPRLKPRDRERIQALIDFPGDRKAAAESLGLGLQEFSRQLRQTVFPNVRRLTRPDS